MENENFGKIAKDKVTGFEGVVTCVAHYMFGCSQYGLSPRNSKETGKRGEVEFFDEGRLVFGKVVVKPASVKAQKNGCEKREYPNKNG